MKRTHLIVKTYDYNHLFLSNLFIYNTININKNI